MEYRTIDDLKKAGFEGFCSVEKLRDDLSGIPTVAGVYMVVYQGNGMPEFLEVGTGGLKRKKDKSGKLKIINPNVPVSELKSNWVKDTCVVYIGKATTLSKRISQYLKFGNGKSIGHWGGRLIWQIKDSKDLQICWKPVDADPREEEMRLIADFKRQYGGKRPFANLQD
ncbi:MAG TPA: hypothetical protein IAC93_07720 [Candidatus Limisoma gallistercoris]|nr:hypothetical protein [Candidatus Limisoma gallistercoris]